MNSKSILKCVYIPMMRLMICVLIPQTMYVENVILLKKKDA